MQLLIKRLQAAIIPNQDIWDSIAIVIAPNSLYDNFDITIESMLKRVVKIIDKIENTQNDKNRIQLLSLLQVWQIEDDRICVSARSLFQPFLCRPNS